MFACLHSTTSASDDLLALALEFSPHVEQTDSQTILFSIDPLRTLIGSPHQIASELCRLGYER